MEDYPGQRRGTSGRAERLNERLLDEFVALHGPALRASGVPERLWGSLLHKLEHEVRDCGRVMQTIGERSPAAPRAHLQAPDWCVSESHRATCRELHLCCHPAGSGPCQG